jgi:hypothetical protein
MLQYGPVNELSSRGEVSSSGSRSVNYDHSGQDAAYKVGDEAASLQASQLSNLHRGDIEGSLATGRRIAELKDYLDGFAATGGQGGLYKGKMVLPGTRIDSESSSSSGSVSRGGVASYHDPNKKEQA